MQAVWLLVAETMVVKGELDREEKEAADERLICLRNNYICGQEAKENSCAQMVQIASRDKQDFIIADEVER
jgi:hypothetical protein